MFVRLVYSPSNNNNSNVGVYKKTKEHLVAPTFERIICNHHLLRLARSKPTALSSLTTHLLTCQLACRPIDSQVGSQSGGSSGSRHVSAARAALSFEQRTNGSAKLVVSLRAGSSCRGQAATRMRIIARRLAVLNASFLPISQQRRLSVSMRRGRRGWRRTSGGISMALQQTVR